MVYNRKNNKVWLYVYNYIEKNATISENNLKGFFYGENKTWYQTSHCAYPEEYERAMTAFERL
jgi:hypothetical protein